MNRIATLPAPARADDALKAVLLAAVFVIATFPALGTTARASSCFEHADDVRDRAVDLGADDHNAAAAAFVRSADTHLKCLQSDSTEYGAQMDAVAADLDNAYDESNKAGSANCNYIYRERSVIQKALRSGKLTTFDRKGLKSRLDTAADECS